MNNEKFGKFIAELRKEKNMTQKDLANKLKITDKAISKWERGLGFPDIVLLKPLSEIFTVSITELLNGERQENNKNDIETQVIQIINKVEEQKKIKKKKTRCIVIIIIAILCIIFALSIYTQIKMCTYNPIRAAIGYVGLEIFDVDYAIVQNIPNKVICAKEGFDIEQYMEDKGFIELKERQLGYKRVFADGNKTVEIICWSIFDGYKFNIYVWDSIKPCNETKEQLITEKTNWEKEQKIQEEKRKELQNKYPVPLNLVGLESNIIEPIGNSVD